MIVQPTTGSERAKLTALLREFDGIGPEDPAAAFEYCALLEQWLERTGPAVDEDLHIERERTACDLWYMQGILHHIRGAHGKAIELLDRSVHHSERYGYLRRRVLALRSIAACYEDIGLQQESTRCIFEALDLAEELDDDVTLGIVSHALALLYQAQGAWSQVLETTMRTKEIAERTDDELLQIRALSGVAVALAYLDRSHEAFPWIDRAKAIAANGRHPLADVYLDMNRVFVLRHANRLSEAVALADRTGGRVASTAPHHAARMSLLLAEVYLDAGDLDRSESMLEQADRATPTGQTAVHRSAFYTVAAKLHEARGDLSRALAMTRRSIEFDREKRGGAATARLIDLERRFGRQILDKTEQIHQLRHVELVDKNEQLASLVRQKEEILHVASHDLRNPLAIVQMLSELLTDDLANEDNAERLAAIKTEASAMGAAIDRLLLPDNDGPPLVLAAVDAVVARSVHDVLPIAEQHAVTLQRDIHAVDLEVDAALLRRSIDDLLGCAVYKASPGGTVSVSVLPQDHCTRIAVETSAVLDASDERGLYIAKRLIERLHGSITLKPSDDGEGTEAIIDLRGT